MTEAVEVARIETQPIAIVRQRVRVDELATVVPQACGAVWIFIRESGFAGAGRNVAVYYPRGDLLHVECGVEVTPEFVGNGEVSLSATPAGAVAHAVHIGPYGFLGETHRAIRSWCSARSHSLAGPNWEIYGHWTADESQLRTDVFYLLD